MKPVSKAALRLALGLALAAPAAHAGEFTFGGKIYADASVLRQHDHVTGARSSDTNVDLKRLYLDADYAFDPAWSVHVTTDFNWLRGERDPDLWLKHAYLQRKFGQSGQLRLGVDDMPWITLGSQWYGYRYIDSLSTSMQKIDDAADWGVHLKGELAPKLDYAFAVVTGAGYKRPSHGNRADVEALLAYHPSAHTVLALGGYDGQRGEDGDRLPLYHTARRVDLMAAYADDTWRFGVRYAYASNWSTIHDTASERGRSWSTWASLRLAKDWSVFARYDRMQPQRLQDPGQRTWYANAGVEWKPAKRVRLALVAKRNAVEYHGREQHSTDEVGIWSEIAF
ncbi:hypothetical protein [Frateuria sp. STR12]|uniref:hypothetical protein n=1 Tax=Frateuria hangzhouensis TaxID=2995589 RepID=UPI002260E5EF|nr:hypothetical protein [Frateuria sp. STR12]MCX7515334.1 hypothetical protein [Frateuria sp. STR12]